MFSIDQCWYVQLVVLIQLVHLWFIYVSLSLLPAGRPSGSWSGGQDKPLHTEAHRRGDQEVTEGQSVSGQYWPSKSVLTLLLGECRALWGELLLVSVGSVSCSSTEKRWGWSAYKRLMCMRFVLSIPTPSSCRGVSLFLCQFLLHHVLASLCSTVSTSLLLIPVV